MHRLTSLKHLLAAGLAIGGIVVACRAATPEAPPLAPAPDPTTPAPDPVPSGPTVPPEGPSTPGPTFPAPDGGAPTSPGPVSTKVELHGERYQIADGGAGDAFRVPDAPPPADALIPADALMPRPVGDARPY